MAFHSTAIIFILFYFAGVNYGKLLRFIFVLVTLILTPDIIIIISLRFRHGGEKTTNLC